MGSRRALVVGINEYPSHPLAYCVDDAIEVGEVLALPQYGFEVELLIDGIATRKTLRQRLETLLSETEDTALFFFAGHGWATDLGASLATVDSEDSGEGLELEFLRRLAEVRLRPKASLFYVLDCCHAGAATARGTAKVIAPIRGDDVARDLSGLGGAGRVVLAACKDDESSMEEAVLKHGVFSYHLISGLMGDGANVDGEVSASSLFDHISRAFRKNRAQTPVFKGDISGHLVLGRGFPPQIREIVRAEVLERKEAEGAQHLSDYHSLVVEEMRDHDRWKSQGHRRACGALDALLQWTDATERTMTGIATRPSFHKLRADVLGRWGDLCRLDSGTATVEGTTVDKLGHGGFGTVWRVATPGEAPRRLAYKVFHPQDLDNAEKVHRFKNGFQHMEMLDHPNIVKVHRLTRCPYGYFMELIDGPNLRQWVGTLESPVDILGVLLTIAETLNHAHGRQVVHRDLKPENVLLDFDVSAGWSAYLTDFDLSWYSTASELTKSALGAFYYASPEQLNKPGSASARARTTDVFSFGQVMYFVFCGHDPTAPENALADLQARLLKGWSEEPARRFVALYQRCTAQQPERRPSEFRQICDELSEIRRILRGAQPDVTVLPERFVHEVAFAMTGLQPEVQEREGAFLTLSRKIRIAVSVIPESATSALVSCAVHCLESPVMEGVRHNKLREILMARIDKATQGFSGVQKKPGNQLPFQVLVTHKDVALTFGGVSETARLLGRIVDAVETRG